MEVNVTLHSVMMLGIVFADGFLIGRVRISDGIWPFGVAYVLAAFLHADRINPYMALGGVLAALATYISQMDKDVYKRQLWLRHSRLGKRASAILYDGCRGRALRHGIYRHADVYGPDVRFLCGGTGHQGCLLYTSIFSIMASSAW